MVSSSIAQSGDFHRIHLLVLIAVMLVARCSSFSSHRSILSKRFAWTPVSKAVKEHNFPSHPPRRTQLFEGSSERDKSPFFISTPIYYVNGQPHLGHAYTSVVSDVIARFQRADGRPVYFLTGTDEHGQKVEQSAVAAGKTPIQFADEVSQQFRHLVEVLGCSHDDFIRTTEIRHKEAVAKLWETLTANGHIYLGAYEGW